MAHGAQYPHKTMENSALFDLNEAVRRWRERLIGLRAFGADDLEELETHLREAVSELQAGGLSQEEAFLVATERLGSDGRLAEEFAKTNARRIWTGRAMCMLGGVVAGLVMKALVEFGLGFVYYFSLWRGLNVRLVVVGDFLTQWTLTASFIGVCCWWLARRNQAAVATVGKCFRRPVWTGAALVLALFGLQALSNLPAFLWQRSPNPASRLSAADNAIMHWWSLTAMLMSRLMWVAAIPLLAAYLWKSSRTVVSPMPALPSDRLAEDEQVSAGQLASQGLSRSESYLVLALRRGYRPGAVAAKPQLVSGIWLERGFWMMVGMVTFWMLRDFVDRPAWMLVPASGSQPLWQHFNGLMGMCLPLALVGAVVAAFWKGATGARKRSGWLCRVFEQTPVRGALWFAVLAVLWEGSSACYSLVQQADAQPAILSRSFIEIVWWTCRSLLVELLLPAILLVWIGNRYQTRNKAASS